MYVFIDFVSVYVLKVYVALYVFDYMRAYVLIWFRLILYKPQFPSLFDMYSLMQVYYDITSLYRPKIHKISQKIKAYAIKAETK